MKPPTPWGDPAFLLLFVLAVGLCVSVVVMQVAEVVR